MTAYTVDVERMTTALKHRLGTDDATMGALVHATGMLIHCLQHGETDIERIEGAAAFVFAEATHLEAKAQGRKLKDSPKRNRLVNAAELLRDAADLLEKVAL